MQAPEPESGRTDRVRSERRAKELRAQLLEMAREADAQGADERASVLSEARFLLADYERSAAPPYEVEHEQQMDRYRALLAMALLAILFAVIVIGIISEEGIQGVAEIAAPVSGLAGIAIGWLFSSGRQG
ncbi:MAG TPA: hypothetical protein VF529_19955 [Solirubrobacteraceae bacterium]|jgi:small-conductance mechanosensitive channel